MNYRHAFHAGNFADVVKHAVLARVVAHLLKKDTAFRVIDTHAGSGIYDLHGPEALRSPEWRDGIGRVLHAEFDAPSQALLESYLGAVRALNPDGALNLYPGSPALVRAWLRRQDRLIACELEPGAAQALTRHIGRDKRVKVIAIDGWTGLSAFIPPKERRGLVLIDPPYEHTDEFSRLAEALCAAHAKWPTGIFYAWYPVKTGKDARQLCRTLAPWAGEKSLRVELLVEPVESATGLRGSGQIIINPPWTLAAELRILLPALAKILAPGVRNAVRIGPVAA